MQASSRLLWRLVGALLLAVTWNIDFTTAQLTVHLPDNPSPLNPDRITVGRATDLIIEVDCKVTPDGNTTWSFFNGTLVANGLEAFGVTQGGGRLRIYPITLLEEDVGNDNFTCVSGSEVLQVHFELGSDLFYTEPLPTSITPSEVATFSCPIPDIPPATVITLNTSNTLRCSVTTERGIYVSGTVAIVDDNGTAPAAPVIEAPLPETEVIITTQPNTIILQCNTASDPMPDSVRWLGPTNSEVSASSSFNLPISSGIYTCEVTLDETVRVTHTYVLLVFIQSIGGIDPVPPVAIDQVDTITLTCSFRGNPIPVITWTKLGVELPSTQTATGHFLDVVTGKQENAMSVLTVSTSDLMGEDTFECTGEVSANGVAPIPSTMTVGTTITSYSLVEITQDPSPTISDPLVTGDTASFSCEVMSIPAPTVVWFRRMPGSGVNVPLAGVSNIIIGSLMNLGNSVYRSSVSVTVMGVDDFAEYFCEASNDFISGQSSTITLIAAVSPIITGPPIDPDTVAVDDPVIILTCTASGLPRPLITWEDGMGMEVTDGGIFSIMTTIMTSILVIDVTSDALNGTQYRCEAVNTAGTDASEFVTVIVGGVPTSVAPVAISNILTTQATVSWQEPFSHFNLTAYTVTVVAPQLPLFEEVTRFQPGMSEFDNRMFTVTSLMPATDYTATVTAENRVGTGTEASENFTTVSTPGFLEDPAEVRVADNETAQFSCVASSIPPPSITWEDGEGESVTDGGDFSITTQTQDDGSVLSMLEFTAMVDVNNGTEYRCVANNGIGEAQSELGLLLIGGPPGSVDPVQFSNTTARQSTITWQDPLPILSVTHYMITVTNMTEFDPPVTGNTMASFNVSANETQVVVDYLRPFRDYKVEVVAVNRVGGGPTGVVEFTTLTAAPEAAPTDVMTSATQPNSIAVSWGAPPQEFHNGIIVGYRICFRSLSVPQDCVSSTSTFETLLTLDAGTTYDIDVAADNGNNLTGPFSEPVSQETLALPPAFPSGPLQTAGEASTTTIPIRVPSIPGSSFDEFSHFWVIVLKLSGSTITDSDLTGSPTVLFPNSTSVNSSSTSPGQPYVAAEVSSDDLREVEIYVLGDESQPNDFPSVYVNAPLEPGTRYTAFLWGFVPSVDGGQTVVKRQASDRQYDVFSSSDFLPSISTDIIDDGNGDDLSGGAIAGIVIALLIFIIVLIGAAVIIFLMYGVKKVKKLGPPPSRHGSMRLREAREIILTNVSVKASELQDLNPDDVRHPLTIEDFPDYVKKMHANTDHLFSEEYEILTIKSPNLQHQQCSMPYNVNKNRYANIMCYDESRVQLSRIPAVDGSDYINANYIDGYQRRNAYIGTQGPLPNTTPDFWRMVWEQQSCCIIMLTNLVEKSRAKCHQYWPEAGTVSFGDLVVTLIDTQELAYYTIRTFRMNRGNDRREVKQFHYTGWPDFGVPDHPNPTITFVRRLNNFKRTTEGPDVIHCSAGVGRSGTLITIQAMMQMMNEEGRIDVFNFVLGMRRQRNYMVQTERQYIFIHDTMLELIKIGDTEVTIQNLRKRFKELQAQNSETENSGLDEEYIRINELEELEQLQFHSAKLTVNLPKNRFPQFIPYDAYRVRLLMHPGVSGSDYINAAYIDGYQRRHQYVVTQGPMKHTVDDFWRMIWEHRVSAMLMICELEEKGVEQCVRYWPSDKIRQHGDLFVELIGQHDFATYTMREFSITNTKINESRQIKHFHYTDWSEDRCPSNAAAIIDLIGVLQKTQHQGGGGPIVVHGSSPVGRAGTFCILSNALEQLKVEGIVDLFFAVHSLRKQQPRLIKSSEQYRFCYSAVLEFLDSFDHYANFD